MKATIEVSDRKEADLIRAGLNDPSTRAAVKIMGVLAGRNIRSATRILAFVNDLLDEEKSGSEESKE